MDSRPAGRRASLDILGCSTARLQGGAFLLRQHMHRSAAEILLPRVWAICFGMGMAWSWVAGWTAHWIALLAYCSRLGEICSPSGGDQSRHAQPSSSDPTDATRTPIDATVACSSIQCITACARRATKNCAASAGGRWRASLGTPHGIPWSHKTRSSCHRPGRAHRQSQCPAVAAMKEEGCRMIVIYWSQNCASK